MEEIHGKRYGCRLFLCCLLTCLLCCIPRQGPSLSGSSMSPRGLDDMLDEGASVVCGVCMGV